MGVLRKIVISVISLHLNPLRKQSNNNFSLEKEQKSTDIVFSVNTYSTNKEWGLNLAAKYKNICSKRRVIWYPWKAYVRINVAFQSACRWFQVLTTAT